MVLWPVHDAVLECRIRRGAQHVLPSQRISQQYTSWTVEKLSSTRPRLDTMTKLQRGRQGNLCLVKGARWPLRFFRGCSFDCEGLIHRNVTTWLGREMILSRQALPYDETTVHERSAEALIGEIDDLMHRAGAELEFQGMLRRSHIQKAEPARRFCNRARG